MPRNQSARWLLIAASLLAFAAFPGLALRAETLPLPYDLDSLIYLSTDVAEVEITRSYSADDLDLIDVKVTLVHKGGYKKGQTVVVADGAYGRPKNAALARQRLAVGDRLVIFDGKEPLDGGMRFVQGGHVFTFSQRIGGGNLLADVPFEPVKTKLLTVESFREKVKSSLRDTEEWARLVDAKQDKLDGPLLLKLLGDRSKLTYSGRDYFMERICIRFANTHDIILLSQALPLAKQQVSTLQRGFGTPKGRDYLLAKVMDEKEPMPARLRYSHALHYADPVYRSTLTEINANAGCRHLGEADEGNSGYITRIAKAAQATGRHEELCGSLVRCIDYFGQGILQSKPAPMMADLRGGLAVLKEIYDTKPSQSLQFAIEKATAHVPGAYEKLKSPCGSFISILRAVDPAKYTKPEKRSLIFESEYRTSLRASDVVNLRLSVVLIHQGTQKKVVLPSQVEIRGWSLPGSGWIGVGGGGVVELPKDLPVGTYRVFYQVTDGNKVVSTGHYFAADL